MSRLPDASELTAVAAAADVASGARAPCAYLADLLRRWDRDLKFSNCLVQKDAALDALRAAVTAESTEATRTGRRFATTGPLASVPFVCASSIDIAGFSTTGGNAVLEQGRATVDAGVIAALRAAGAQVFGIANGGCLNMPGLFVHPVHGAVKNPFSAAGVVAGGPNAGAAALVAAHVVPFALGLDTAGDVRVPASLCGVVGFRPSLGRYPHAGLLSLSPSLDSVGILARTVEDVQLVDAVLSAGHRAAGAGASAASAAAPAVPSPSPTLGNGGVGSVAASPSRLGATGNLKAIAEAEAAAAAAAAAAEVDRRARALARARCAPDASHVAGIAARREEAALRLLALSSSSSPSGPRPVAAAPADPALVAALPGLRLGRLSGYDCTDAAAAAVFEAAVARLVQAGAVVVLVELQLPPDDDAPLPSSGDGGSGNGQQQRLAAAVAGVIDPLLGFEAPRELAVYLAGHTAPPPTRRPRGDGEEEGEEEEEEDGGDGEEDAAARAAAARARRQPRPLDTVTTVRAVLEAACGTPADRAFLVGQTASSGSASAVTRAAYTTALAARRPALQAAVARAAAAAGVSLLLYPATPSPAAPLRATDEPAACTNGAAAYYVHLRLAAAAGLPALTVPCGLTAPAPGALRGMPGAERLPVALELLGSAPGADAAVLAAGRALQALQSALPDPVLVQRWAEGVTGAAPAAATA